jgi:ABC-2 type transport system permease protein
VQSWITASDYPDETSAYAALSAQKIGVAVIIPETFTSEYFAGEVRTTITILQDPTLSIGPTVVRDMLTSLLDGVAGGGVAFKTINTRMNVNNKVLEPAKIPALLERYSSWYANFQRALFHSPKDAALVTVSPVVGSTSTNQLQNMMGLVMAGQMIFFSFFTSAYAMQSILQEAEEGTLARLFTTPTDRTVILTGKFIAVFLTVVIQGLVMLAAGRYLFQINWGTPASIALSLLGQMFASVGLAVLLVSLLKSTKQAGPIFGGALTGLGMVSGLFTANISMPESFNAIGSFTPQGWVLKAWKLTLTGQAPTELLVPFLVLAVMGIVMFTIGAALFRKRFA